MSDAQDEEKVREPQRPCCALDGVTQRQASHRECGGAEGRPWSWIRGPVGLAPLLAPGLCWGQGGKASLSPCLCPTASGTLQESRQTDGKLGWGGGWRGASRSHAAIPSCAKHQAEPQRDGGEQGLTRAQHASGAPLQPTLNKVPIRAQRFWGGRSPRSPRH